MLAEIDAEIFKKSIAYLSPRKQRKLMRYPEQELKNIEARMLAEMEDAPIR
jgi:hypothetical protein